MIQALSKVGALLHLKERYVGSKDNSGNEPVPISSFLKVYSFEIKQETKLNKNQDEVSKQS
jgi:hypothetical protein